MDGHDGKLESRLLARASDELQLSSVRVLLFAVKQAKGVRPRTSGPRARAAFVLLCHPLRHQILDVPFGIPSVVRFNQTACSIVVAGANLDLVVIGKVALAGNVGK